MHGRRIRDNGQMKQERFRLNIAENISMRTARHGKSAVFILEKFKVKLSNLIRHCN